MPTLDQNTPQSYIPYLATGTGVFAGSGSPEGIQNGGIGSIYSDLLTGNLYTKTTAYATLTGWSLIGGGGSGTVTSVGLTVPSSLFVSPVAGSPVTTTGSLALALASQSQNLVFASPNGASGLPTFRALTSADLSLAASAPAGGIQYNDGANGFSAENGFLFDAATGTLQIGVSPTRSGRMQLRSLVSGSVTQTVGTPSSAHVIAWPDALPSANDLLRAVGVSGANVTLGWVAPSALGFPAINATDGVIPYRSSATAFADSPISRISASQIQIPDGSLTNPTIRFSTNNTGIAASGFNVGIVRAGVHQMSLGLDVILSSSGNVTWGSSTVTSTADTGLNRRQAGYVRVTNGSTGIGGLLVGGSSATPVGQTHLINGAVGVEPLYLEAIASTSVPTIRGVQSGIQSFAFFPTGKIIGGMNSPACNQQTAMIGNAKSDVSTIGNVGTGVDNLLAFVIQANALANTGDYAEFDAFGEFAANVDNKTLKVVYGATTIFNTGATPFDGGNWRVNAKILRTGATAGKSIVTFWNNGLVSPFLQEIFVTTESFSANKTVQFTAEATTTDDITQLHLESKLVVALTS